ncbi:MAG TPA: hypothetical protein VGG74_08010 [Kofleriaceae bacterium]|jgi:hypothetical protein
MRTWFAAILVATLASTASARTEKTLAYPRAEAWAASVRFIRVDAHLKVTEKDADAGYVLFEMHEDGKTFRGALELADITEDNRHAVRFVLTIEDRPSWLELQLMDKLVTKLRDELGEPTPPADKPDEKPKDDDKPDEKPKDDDKPKDGGDDKKKSPAPDRDAPPISSTP